MKPSPLRSENWETGKLGTAFRTMQAMRVTLFGASGLLGEELVRELKAESLTALSSKDADLVNPGRSG